MPFCPSCGYEYVEGVRRCSDCDVELVAELPEEDQDEEQELIELHTFPGDVYAEMVKEALKSEGIACFLRKDPLLSGITHGSTEGGTTTILVKKGDFKRSEEIMAQMLDHI